MAWFDKETDTSWSIIARHSDGACIVGKVETRVEAIEELKRRKMIAREKGYIEFYSAHCWHRRTIYCDEV